MRSLCRPLILCLFFALGCGSSGSSSSDIPKACTNAMKYCPSGYAWSAYASDENTCNQIFNCTYSLYTGTCRGYISDGAACLAAISDSSGCAACSAILLQPQQSCPEPTSCLPTP